MRIRSLLLQAIDRYFTLEVNQRLYINALVFLLIAILSLLLPIASLRQGPWILFFIYWLAVTAYDLLRVYHLVYSTTLGKAVLLLLFSLCTNFAIVLASQIVNSVSSFDPLKFPHTVALLTILNIPFFVVAGFGLIYFVLLASSGLLLMFHMLPDEKLKAAVIPGYSPQSQRPLQKTTRLVQVISIAVFSGFVFSLAGKSSTVYERFLSDTAAAFIYHWEMYSHAACRLEAGAKAAFVADEKVLMGLKEGASYKFIIRECKANAA